MLLLGMAPHYESAFRDVFTGVLDWRMWGRMGWRDVRKRYARSVIGPFWSTLSLALFVISMSFIWARLWNVNLREYMPFLCAGMIAWTMLQSIIVEGCATFTGAEGLIKTLRFPYTLLTTAVVWRNIILFFHNMAVYVVVVLVAGVKPTLELLLIVPALLLFAFNGIWVATLFGMIGARYRDMTMLVTSLLQIFMFVTPIFWSPDQLRGRAVLLVDLNVLYHFIELLRQPMLGKNPSPHTWFLAAATTFVGWSITMLIFSRFRRRLPYWL